MKKFYQIFLIALCVSLAACQATALTAERDTVCCAMPPNPVVFNDEQLIKNFEKTSARVSSSWRLINPDTKKQIYHLYLPTKALAKAGVKVSALAGEDAVPVYVKTANGGYEPLLTDNAGKHNRAVGAENVGYCPIVTTDGLIVTTRRLASGWNTALTFAPNAARGITMSADLKQVVDTDTPPPAGWIPEKTAARNGTLEKFNVRVKSGSGYAGENMSLTVSLLAGSFTGLKARLVQTSLRSDVGIIKVDAPGKLEKAELSDNDDQLKKGENLYLVYAEFSAPPKLAVMTITVADTLYGGETGEVIRLFDNLDNSATVSKSKADVQRAFFTLGSSVGAPIYNKRGQVVGIYSEYKSDANQIHVVPIRYAIHLLN